MKVSVTTLLAEKAHNIYSIDASASVLDAVNEMNHRGVGSIIVLDQGKLVGIFTERDVLRRVVVPALPADSTPVSDVMTKDVDTFAPNTTVEAAMAHMNKERHRHVPVVEGERILGLVSIGDITRYLSKNFENEAQNLLSYFTGTYPEG
ncbi:MAG: CBS domain-containing protein [Verrucomicrobia bacterium]|nr:CBS domain-containing protein [Verrucomicrobiota bacterium]MDA1065301.1 CBS domain-containing protein [Verrucomicrobiota bacterium]